MPGKERKRKWGIETAAHNCMEIEGSLYVITHIKRFRLGHKWAIIQSQAWLRKKLTIAVLIQCIAMAYANFYCVTGKTGDYV